MKNSRRSSEPELKKYREQMMGSPILRCDSQHIGAEYKVTGIQIYREEKYAAQAVAMSKVAGVMSGMRKTESDMRKMAMQRTQSTQKDNWVYRTMVFDKEFMKLALKNQKERIAESEKRQKEREEQEKAKSKEKKNKDK